MRSLLEVVTFAVLAIVPFGISAQYNGQAPNPVGNPSGGTGPKIAGDTSDYLYGVDPDFRHRMLVSRREEMKRHMMENASRLLELSKQLDSDLQGHEPTQADVKRLDDIAKLARTVRDQMRQ